MAAVKRSMMTRTFVLVFHLLPLISAVNKERLEQIRLLHEHDGIDTATVHISYSQSSGLRRLTKREAVENLLPRRHDNLNVKMALNSTGRVFDLQLQPSKLQIHGALVKVMHQEGHQSEFRVQDKGCHYQGSFDDGKGMASVHFCDGVLIGAAHTGDTEYHFHSHKHPLPHEVDDNDDNSNSKDPFNRDDPLGIERESGQDPFHIIVSWRSAVADWLLGNTEDSTSLTNDYIVIDEYEGDEEEEEEKRRMKRQVEQDTTTQEHTYDDTNDDPPVAPPHPTEVPPSYSYNATKVPVAEFGIIIDEEFLRDYKFIYPTHQDLIRMLMVKYTGVQALYGNPRVTGFNLTIQIKLVYFWEKNPDTYAGSNLSMGGRMAGGKIMSQLDPLFKTTDVAALFTSRSKDNVVGMAFLGGACLWGAKTYTTRKFQLNWNTESHEFGHLLGLLHVPGTCQNSTPPYDRGFMNDVKNVFQPCYTEALKTRLQTKALHCLFKEDVNTTNIPLLELQRTFPVLVFGLDNYCRTEYRIDSTYVFQDDSKPCGDVLCSVTDETNPEYGMSQTSQAFEGMPCGSKGQVCIGRTCRAPTNFTTINIVDTVTGSSSWLSWYPLTKQCTSACGSGVEIFTRECGNRERMEACQGSRYRARLCNTQPCPGDDLRNELGIRQDRANYTCSLLHARGGNLTQYLRPYAKNIPGKQLWESINMGSCLVSCDLVPRPSGSPNLQRQGFDTVMQADGTLCGPISVFDRTVLNITTRCLRGRCVEFGCDGFSMENRRGSVLDLCGVCGGLNNTCRTGQTPLRLSNNGETKFLVEIPAGTTNIIFAVQPDRTGQNQDLFVKLALTDKDDSNVIVPGSIGNSRITTNTNNPLNFAGTYWTSLDNKIVFAPGPIDRPMKMSAKLMRNSTPVDVVIVFGYKPPNTVPSPPVCQNGGVANSTNGGCKCSGIYHGRKCEYSCHDLCFNGALMMPSTCACNCSTNPNTNQTSPCNCLGGFAGPDCKECTISHCYNGGTRNSRTCQCQCPPQCQGSPDCSDCNFNPLLPYYRGQYGRGSLEDPLKSSGTTKRPDDGTTKRPGETSGQSPVIHRKVQKRPLVLASNGRAVRKLVTP